MASTVNLPSLAPSYTARQHRSTKRTAQLAHGCYQKSWSITPAAGPPATHAARQREGPVSRTRAVSGGTRATSGARRPGEAGRGRGAAGRGRARQSSGLGPVRGAAGRGDADVACGAREHPGRLVPIDRPPPHRSTAANGQILAAPPEKAVLVALPGPVGPSPGRV